MLRSKQWQLSQPVTRRFITQCVARLLSVCCPSDADCPFNLG